MVVPLGLRDDESSRTLVSSAPQNQVVIRTGVIDKDKVRVPLGLPDSLILIQPFFETSKSAGCFS